MVNKLLLFCVAANVLGASVALIDGDYALAMCASAAVLFNALAIR